jgi:methyltransferase (TIGR00027 family)
VSASNGSIENISDTARWVAMYRALESERPDALFRDPYARRLAGERGAAILGAMPNGRSWGWPMVVRTCVMDELILRAIERDGAKTVLNLAAGLDARAYRLPLPRDLRWIDVDLPEILTYKQRMLAGETPACRLESAAVDLTDADRRREQFAEAAGTGPALVVSEGLLVYLGEDQVRALATDLHAEPALRWWLIDLGSPRLLKMIERRWGSHLKAGNAPFRFAPAEGTRFFEPLGWREREYRSVWEESRRLKRQMPMAWLWNLLARFSSEKQRQEGRRMSGIVLLERV